MPIKDIFFLSNTVIISDHLFIILLFREASIYWCKQLFWRCLHFQITILFTLRCRVLAFPILNEIVCVLQWDSSLLLLFILIFRRHIFEIRVKTFIAHEWIVLLLLLSKLVVLLLEFMIKLLVCKVCLLYLLEIMLRLLNLLNWWIVLLCKFLLRRLMFHHHCLLLRLLLLMHLLLLNHSRLLSHGNILIIIYICIVILSTKVWERVVLLLLLMIKHVFIWLMRLWFSNDLLRLVLNKFICELMMRLLLTVHGCLSLFKWWYCTVMRL